MKPLSEAQYRAATDGGLPDPEPIAEGLWSVAVPMPGELLDYTLTVVHIASDGAVTIVDPGWETPEVHEHLTSALAGLGKEVADIRTIVVTHAHPDHVGAADTLRRASGARLLMHEREQAGLARVRAGGLFDAQGTIAGWGAPDEAKDRLAAQLSRVRHGVVLPEPADALLRDGDRLPVPGFECEVVPTPGHTEGHICLVDRDRGLIFSGDHVLPTLFPGVGLGIGADPDTENPVAAYLVSLDRLAPYDDFEVVPGHGYRFRGLEGRRCETSEHILARAGEVAAALAADPEASIWGVASRLTWSAGWERLSGGSMLASALLQTGLYVGFVRDGGMEGDTEVRG
jgi:glyoxylase-like metal-dependent hydrolase (beta-lactamase superfamily II)